MKILLSAYACEPNRGSEQGVGWGWAIELSKSNEVWVLTRARNKERIDRYLNEHPEYRLPSLHFIYVDISKTLTFWKKGNRGIRLYYMLWQWAAYKNAKKWHANIGFDYCQHITFVSYTQPTYLYKLGIPMIWGPVSGGENIPSEMRIMMTKEEKIFEKIRKISQRLAIFFPSIRKTMQYSKLILVTTEETKKYIPQKYNAKTYVVPAIGLETIPKVSKIYCDDGIIRIIMAGRLIYWKAFDIGIKSFLSILHKYNNIELHILGEGKKKNELIKLAGEYYNKKIFFDPPVAHDDIYSFFSKYDIFLNTTLRDSGCMTMMEAMAVKLPCISIGCGGPKVLCDMMAIDSIVPSNYEETVKRVAEMLEKKIFSCKPEEYLLDNLLFSHNVKMIESILEKTKDKN